MPRLWLAFTRGICFPGWVAIPPKQPVPRTRYIKLVEPLGVLPPVRLTFSGLVCVGTYTRARARGHVSNPKGCRQSVSVFRDKGSGGTPLPIGPKLELVVRQAKRLDYVPAHTRAFNMYKGQACLAHAAKGRRP